MGSARAASDIRAPWYRAARKVAVSLAGGSVLAFGVVLLVLPGPSSVVIPLGLTILATEFLWARRWLRGLRRLLRALVSLASHVPDEARECEVQPSSERSLATRLGRRRSRRLRRGSAQA